MIKTVALIVRRPDHGREAFAKHYEEIHVPTALPLLDGLRGYRRNHVRPEEDVPAPGFDCMTEFWYASQEVVDAMVARIQGEPGEALRADELTFMDKAANRSFLVEETVSAEPADPRGLAKYVARIRGDAAGHAAVEAEARELLRGRGPGEPASGLLLRRVTGHFTGSEPDVTGLLCVWAPPGAEARQALATWAAGVGAERLVEVREHETPCTPGRASS